MTYLIEWDGGWKVADTLTAAHQIAHRMGLSGDYRVTENTPNGRVLYEGIVN